MTTNIDKHGTGPVLDIDKLKVTFATDGGDVYAVRDVSLEVNPGEVVAIVGESGSGKTVTAKTILGLLPETATSSGAVLINGNNVISVSAAKLRQIRGRDVAMVFQEPSTALNPVFTVGWQIAEGIRAHAGSGGHRVSAKEAKARAIEALRKVGIPDPETRVNYYPHQFSGGQKQRVVIAAALALNPGLIVADEPTTALDVTVQAEILDLLRNLRDQYGTSIVLITHNMGVVADLADRVVVMYQGDVVEEAPSRVLFAQPREDYTKKLLAAVPHLGRNSASAGLTERAHQGGKVLVEAKNLTIEYPGRLGSPGFKAVDGVSFTVSEGEVFGLVGESGSGKTTIGRAIAGLNRTTGGSLKVLGYEMLNLKERTFKPLRKEIGFVFQDPAASFNPQLTIGDCVAEPLIIHSHPTPAQARKRVGELLESVQLPASYADTVPARTVRRAAAAGVTGQGADPEPQAPDCRRTDLGTGRLSPGRRAGTVQGHPEGVRIRGAVHQPRPRGGGHPVALGGGALQGQARGAGTGQRRSWAPRSMITRGASSHRCRCLIRTSRPGAGKRTVPCWPDRSVRRWRCPLPLRGGGHFGSSGNVSRMLNSHGELLRCP